MKEDMRKNEKLCLLITGCVNPNPNQQSLSLKKPEERLRQYLDSIEFYIRESLIKDIIFCDNSDYIDDSYKRLKYMAQECGKRFEWLHYLSDPSKVVEHGKGYGEGEILEYIIDNSFLIKENEKIAKVTGRLKIENINNIIEKVNGNCYLNMDIYWHANQYDTRFYIMSIKIYKKYFSDLYKRTWAKEGERAVSIEELFYKQVLESDISIRCIQGYPSFLGCSGGNGRNYSSESKIRIMFFDLLCKLGVFNSAICIRNGGIKFLKTVRNKLCE